jgi:large subunit ribosomal protein L7Ae
MCVRACVYKYVISLTRIHKRIYVKNTHLTCLSLYLTHNTHRHQNHEHLFAAKAKNFGIGGTVRATTDLSRMVRWPRYIRLQRQRVILKKRLKVPPSLNQFTKTLEKNQATTLFRLLSQYRPESALDKKKRLAARAEAESKGQTVESEKPKVVKFGINHVTQLVENKKAKFVVIAHDVDPIDIVVWLPALCRKMAIPYCIIKGQARLGHLVHHKRTCAVAVTDIRKEDQQKLGQIISTCESMYSAEATWGGGIMGKKTQARLAIRAKLEAAENAKRR